MKVEIHEKQTDGSHSIDSDWAYHLEALDELNEVGYHTEGVQRMPTPAYGQDSTAPPTYNDDLVTGGYWHRDQPESLRRVAYGDPVGFNLTVGVADAALGDGWRYVAEYGDREEVPAAAAIHKDFIMGHVHYWLKQGMTDGRIFGDSLIFISIEDSWQQDVLPTENTSKFKMDVLSPEYFDLPTYADGKKKINMESGRPIQVKVRPVPTDEARDFWAKYDDFIHYIPIRIGRTYKGYSAMYSAWSYITGIRHSSYNLIWAMQKFGTGTMIIYLSGRLTPDTKASIKKMMQRASQQRAGMVDTSLIDKIEYVGPTSSFTNNIPECITLFAKFTAAASGLPVSFLMGQIEGASGSADVAKEQFYDMLSKVQQGFVPIIKETARRRGHPTDWKVEYNAVYATSERQAAEIRYLNAQAEGAEADAELKKKQAERGEISVGFMPQQQAGPKDTKKDNNPGGIQ